MELATRSFERNVLELTMPADKDELMYLVTAIYSDLYSFDKLCAPLFDRLCDELDVILQAEEFANLIQSFPELSKNLLRFSARSISQLEAMPINSSIVPWPSKPI